MNERFVAVCVTANRKEKAKHKSTEYQQSNGTNDEMRESERASAGLSLSSKKQK